MLAAGKKKRREFSFVFCIFFCIRFFFSLKCCCWIKERDTEICAQRQIGLKLPQKQPFEACARTFCERGGEKVERTKIPTNTISFSLSLPPSPFLYFSHSPLNLMWIHIIIIIIASKITLWISASESNEIPHSQCSQKIPSFEAIKKKVICSFVQRLNRFWCYHLPSLPSVHISEIRAPIQNPIKLNECLTLFWCLLYSFDGLSLSLSLFVSVSVRRQVETLCIKFFQKIDVCAATLSTYFTETSTAILNCRF